MQLVEMSLINGEKAICGFPSSLLVEVKISIICTNIVSVMGRINCIST